MSDQILIVDDEKEIADLLDLYLANEGYTIHKCLGLAIAKEIVELHGGRISVSSVGHEMQFMISLPECQEGNTEELAKKEKNPEKHRFLGRRKKTPQSPEEDSEESLEGARGVLLEDGVEERKKE